MPFVNDTFTEGFFALDLASHVGETGATWTKHPSSGTGTLVVEATTDRVYTDATGVVYYQPSGSPLGADYEVEAPVHCTSSTLNEIGVVARQSASTLAGYCLRYVAGSSQWVLSRINAAGVHTPLGTYSQTLTVGVTYVATLRVAGSSLTALIDGVVRITATDATISTAGKPGVMGTGTSLSNTGVQLASFTASDTSTLAGATAGSSSDTGTLTGPVLLAGSSVGSSSDAGALAGPAAIAGTSAGGSADTGFLESHSRPRWAIAVRERPPLRTTIELIAPTGRRYRWAGDDSPENAPASARFSSTMPGGFESYDGTLARKIGVDYADLEPFTTLRVRDAAGDIVGEYRLERAPQASGDQLAITPSAVGYQAVLDDNKSVRLLGIDRDLSRWQGPSRERQIEGSGYSPFNGPSVSPDPTSGIAALRLETSGEIPAAAEADAYYDAGPGLLVGRVAWDGADDKNLAGGAYTFKLYAADADHGDGAFVGDFTGDTGAHSAELASPKRWVLWALNHHAAASGDERWRQLRGLRVIGADAQIVGTGNQQGVRASDVIELAVRTWAPMLHLAADSIEPSGFIIPHLTFPDLTTVSEVIRQATRFGLQDWAVWEPFTFYWHSRGARGRTWRARTGPSQLQETGPQVDRVWESVIVSYQDVDGSTRTVGPPNSGADTEDAALKDTDPANPANELGIVRRTVLSMGTSTPAAAVEVGRRFLLEQKLLNSSGSARFVGHVEDDRGILHPYHHVRAGDTVIFVDSQDPSPRRIVRAEHDQESRTCSVDIDAPPEALDALLERLAVVLVPLGL